MSWSVNNTAHRYLWIFCRSLHIDFALRGETLVTFEEGGEWLNSFILDVPAGASADVAKAKAEIFAKKFNAWMTIERESTYEQNYGKIKAIEELATAMLVTNSKLNSVGDTVDNIYRCKGEMV